MMAWHIRDLSLCSSLMFLVFLKELKGEYQTILSSA